MTAKLAGFMVTGGFLAQENGRNGENWAFNAPFGVIIGKKRYICVILALFRQSRGPRDQENGNSGVVKLRIEVLAAKIEHFAAMLGEIGVDFHEFVRRAAAFADISLNVGRHGVHNLTRGHNQHNQSESARWEGWGGGGVERSNIVLSSIYDFSVFAMMWSSQLWSAL